MNKKTPGQIHGLWCRANKKFYYLECGLHTVRNPLDRLRNSLRSRNLVGFSERGFGVNEEPLVRMTLATAQEKDYEFEPIYLNPHIQAQVEAAGGSVTQEVKNPWRKDG